LFPDATDRFSSRAAAVAAFPPHSPSTIEASFLMSASDPILN
jgi:hypothetical protein